MPQKQIPTPGLIELQNPCVWSLAFEGEENDLAWIEEAQMEVLNAFDSTPPVPKITFPVHNHKNSGAESPSPGIRI